MSWLRREDRLLVASALAFFLGVGAIRAFISAIYFQNLSTLGINGSAALALLFLSPALLLVPVVARQPRWILLGSAGALVLGRVLMDLLWGRAGHLFLAGVAVAAAFLLLPALAHQARHALGAAGTRAAAIGAGLGFALDAALTYWGTSVDPTQRMGGLLLTIPAGALLLHALVEPWPAPRAWTAVAEGRGALLAGAGVGAWIFLEHAALASPHALARWNDLPVALVAVGTVAGLCLPLVLALRGATLDWRWITGLNVVALVAVLDHVFFHSEALLLTLVPAQAALVLDLGLLLRGATGGSLRHAGAAFLAGAFVALLAHFAFAFALNFGFVPLPGLWEGGEKWLLPGAFLLASLPALAVARREEPTARAPDPLPRGLVAALVAVPLVILAAGAATPGAPVIEPTSPTLRVMSFNVHQGFDNAGFVNPDAFERLLREESPDVVFLQESDTPRVTSANLDVTAALAKRLGYHEAYGPPTSAESFGVAILSRHPIVSWDAVELTARKDNRWLLQATLDVQGRNVTAFAVHLGLPADEREAQAAQMLARVRNATGPVILAGDLNSCPFVVCPDYDGPNDTVYADVAAVLRDGYLVAGGADPNAAETWTYEAKDLIGRIDYVLVSDHWDVVAYRALRTDAALAASDHLPVVAELRLR